MCCFWCSPHGIYILLQMKIKTKWRSQQTLNSNWRGEKSENLEDSFGYTFTSTNQQNNSVPHTRTEQINFDNFIYADTWAMFLTLIYLCKTIWLNEFIYIYWTPVMWIECRKIKLRCSGAANLVNSFAIKTAWSWATVLNRDIKMIFTPFRFGCSVS